MVANDIATLTALAPIKTQQVNLLNQLATDRLRSVMALGFTADRLGMEKRMAGADAEAQRAWQAMLDVAAEAHQLNKTNGALIQQRLQHTQQTLAALTAAFNQSNLYGPDGQPQGVPPGSSGTRGIIGKA